MLAIIFTGCRFIHKRNMSQSFKHVLLVEDDPASLFLLQHLLLELTVGESIQVARNGAEAFTYLESLPAASPAGASFVELNPFLPDLLLVDISMPVMDGLEFLVKVSQGWLCPNEAKPDCSYYQFHLPAGFRAV
jgi:CheY-like chemotaxis protein